MAALFKTILFLIGSYVLVLMGVVGTCPHWSAKRCYLAALGIMFMPIIYIILSMMLGII